MYWESIRNGALKCRTSVIAIASWMLAEKVNERIKQRQIEAAWERHTRPFHTTLQLRADLLEEHLTRDGSTCAYCRIEMVYPWRHGELRSNRATLDHVKPLSKGGLDTYENTCACCQWCNATKADLPLEEFLQLPSFIERRNQHYTEKIG